METNDKRDLGEDLNMTKMNLWNMADNKMREVRHFIFNLRPDENWSFVQQKEFHRRKIKALDHKTANEMLESIGYRYRQQPRIYDEIEAYKPTGKRNKEES